MTDMNKNFQNEIARKIIIQVGLLTLFLCAGLLVVFALEMYWATNATLTTAYVIRMLVEVLAATCIFCLLMFVVLYFISRNVARKSLQPLHEALERERSFTSYASHEFRTPLAVLKGSMEVLIRKPRTETEYRAKITECIGEVDAMNQMVEDLLTLTRVGSGRMTLETKPTDMTDLLNDVISHHAEQLIQRNIHLHLDVQPGGSVLTTDYRAMTTILSNVISNAVKYCNDGGSIDITSRRQDNATMIQVTNTGRGIPRHELDHVFKQFYRGSDAQQHHTKGFGLGLAIVHQFAEIIGATVAMESDSGQPTTITLTIPHTNNG